MAYRKKTLRKHIWVCRSECRNCDEGEWEIKKKNACDPANREVEDCSTECTGTQFCPGAVRYTRSAGLYAKIEKLTKALKEIKSETCQMGIEWGDSNVCKIASDALAEVVCDDRQTEK